MSNKKVKPLFFLQSISLLISPRLIPPPRVSTVNSLVGIFRDIPYVFTRLSRYLSISPFLPHLLLLVASVATRGSSQMENAMTTPYPGCRSSKGKAHESPDVCARGWGKQVGCFSSLPSPSPLARCLWLINTSLLSTPARSCVLE